MNITNTKAKLKTLTDSELDTLYDLVQSEKGERIQFQSNRTHTPNEMCRELSEFFENARYQH